MSKNLIKKTKSLCPNCLDEIEADIFEENGKAIMEKKCEEHGEFKAIVENDVDFYKKILNQKPNVDAKRDTIVIPITYSCNLNCRYCYLPDREHKSLSFQEIKPYIDNPDYQYVSFSGGEPTLYPDLFGLIKYAKSKGKLVCLITNGIKLSSKDYVKNLKDSGLDFILFSLNSFEDNILEKVDGKKLLKTKLEALKNLKKEKIETILSFSWLKDVNDKDFKRVFKFALNNNFVIELRCRVFSMIGRHKQTQDNTLSDFIELMAKATDMPSSDYIKYWLDINKTNPSLFFRPSQYLFHINYYNFVLNTDLAKSLKSSIFTYPKYLAYISKYIGFLNFLRLISRHVFSQKDPSLHINMFSWPDKYDVDLNELRFFQLDHVAIDGSANPFFETMMLNEKIRANLKKVK